MADPDLFAITHQQLGRTSYLRILPIVGISFLLVACWTAWLLFARLAVYATTDQARVEVAQAVYPVEAAVSGRVLKSYLKLGQHVERGDVLVELAAEPEELKLVQEQSHYTAVQAQVQDLQAQLAAEQEALEQERASGAAAVDQARERAAEAREAAKLAQEELDRSQSLFKQGLGSEIEVRRSDSAAKEKVSEAQASEAAVQQAVSQQLSAGGEHRARIESIKTELARSQGELAASDTAQQQLSGEVRNFQIVAAGAGRLGSIVNVRSGAYIHQGDRLATIIPEGRLRIVAEFEPRVAIGRVRPGQSAELRLTGFPFEQYGAISATVTSVGSEVRDGRVRVELDPHLNKRIPLQHGLPGTLEVVIDHVSPLALLIGESGGYLPHLSSSSQAASR